MASERLEVKLTLQDVPEIMELLTETLAVVPVPERDGLELRLKAILARMRERINNGQ